MHPTRQDYCSSILSHTEKEWHGDVGYLFSRTVLKEENHLPPQGVVVVAPLVDLTPVTGPTEFMTGSHMNMGIDYWTTKDATPETPLWKIPAEVYVTSSARN